MSENLSGFCIWHFGVLALPKSDQGAVTKERFGTPTCALCVFHAVPTNPLEESLPEYLERVQVELAPIHQGWPRCTAHENFQVDLALWTISHGRRGV